MISFKAFLAGCWFDHSFLYERDAEGVLHLRCVTCGEATPVLPGQAYPVKPIKALKAKRVKTPKRPSKSLQFPRRA